MGRPVHQVAIIFESNRAFDRRVLEGITSFMQQSDPIWSLYVEDDPKLKLPNWQQWDGDGIIANLDDRKVADMVARLDLPVVGIGGECGQMNEHKRYSCVNADNRHLSHLAFTHLFKIGFRRFAFCAEPYNRTNNWSIDRETAFREFASEAGCHCDVFHQRHTARQWTVLQEKLQWWLRSLTPPIGLMASNDHCARHLLEACRAIGARVPEDFAVIGVDNDIRLCELANPPLTSIEQGATSFGYSAAARLDRMMSGDQPENRCIVIKEGHLVPRRSTDGLAVDDAELAGALQFIRDHACDPIRVDDIIREIPISRSTLESRFKHLLGTTIHAEIHRVQMDHAKTLLTETDLPLPVVAQRAGISSVQYLTTLIHRETGSTPAKIRHRTRGRSRHEDLA